MIDLLSLSDDRAERTILYRIFTNLDVFWFNRLQPEHFRKFNEVFKKAQTASLKEGFSIYDCASDDEAYSIQNDDQYSPETAYERLIKCHEVRQAATVFSKYKAHQDLELLKNETLLISATGQKSKIFSSKEMSHRLLSNLDKLAERTEYFTDLPVLSNYITLRPGTLCYIVAPPKTGKTWLLAALTAQFGKKSYKTVFVSAEMHPDDLHFRVLSYMSGYNSAIPRTYEDTTARGEITDKLTELAGYDISYVQAIGITMQSLASLIRIQAAKGAKIIIIDYIQRILNPAAKDLRMSTTQVSGMLADSAKLYGLCIICASQANRQTHQHEVTEAHHAKESGSIEADADIILTLHDSTKYEGFGADSYMDLTCKIVQRNGQGGVCKLQFNPRTGRYSI